MEIAGLYRQMLRARSFELVVEDLWHRGLIAGEMHLGTGEEAVAAGVVTRLGEGDGLALTHRCSPALVVRGVPLVPMLRELLGCEDGICGGRGGHMHLFSEEHMAATSGIVGASLPTAAGFALANRRLRPGRVAVAFTGTGAMNSGMALETMNLAVAWRRCSVSISPALREDFRAGPAWRYSRSCRAPGNAAHVPKIQMRSRRG